MNSDLIRYIEEARKSGMGDAQIREELLKTGWQEADVNEAMGGVLATPSPSRPRASTSKPLLTIMIALLAAIAIYAGAAYYMTNFQDLPLWPFEAPLEPIPSFTPRPSPSAAVLPSPTTLPTSTVCTLEAKLCPDGSAVGRTGPNCEFAPCPGEEAY